MRHGRAGRQKRCRFCRKLAKAEANGFISRGKAARRRIARLKESDDGPKDELAKLIENEGIHVAMSKMIEDYGRPGAFGYLKEGYDTAEAVELMRRHGAALDDLVRWGVPREQARRLLGMSPGEDESLEEMSSGERREMYSEYSKEERREIERNSK